MSNIIIDEPPSTHLCICVYWMGIWPNPKRDTHFCVCSFYVFVKRCLHLLWSEPDWFRIPKNLLLKVLWVSYPLKNILQSVFASRQDNAIDLNRDYQFLSLTIGMYSVGITSKLVWHVVYFHVVLIVCLSLVRKSYCEFKFHSNSLNLLVLVLSLGSLYFDCTRNEYSWTN